MTRKMVLELRAEGVSNYEVSVDSYAEASQQWQQYRDRNGFGASKMLRRSGILRDPEGNTVARVVYNGRVLSPDYKTLLHDIAGGYPWSGEVAK